KLAKQLMSQDKYYISALSNFINSKLNISDLQIDHVALLPEKFVTHIKNKNPSILQSDIKILSWERIRDAFQHVSSVGHLIGYLNNALGQWSSLVSTSRGGKNADSKKTGLEIVQAALEGKIAPFRSMGRRSGLSGRRLQRDIESGEWKAYKYQISKKEN